MFQLPSRSKGALLTRTVEKPSPAQTAEILSLFTDDVDPPIRECMLTTTDNPFNPFTDYVHWEQFDLSHGYNSASYLARIAVTSNELSDADEALAIERAIDEIVAINVFGVYRKVVKNEQIPLSASPSEGL